VITIVIVAKTIVITVIYAAPAPLPVQ
jgi:hypothetical protein